MTGGQQRVVLTLSMALAILFFVSQPPAKPARHLSLIPENPASPPTPMGFQVEVDGDVQRRGMYTVEPGTTILEALEKAGGISEKLSLDPGNLLERINKNGRLRVSGAGEGKGIISFEALAPKKLKVLSIPVNINTANLEELDTLPGIGPKTAQNIIEYRETYGRFTSLEDLLNVRGIGPKKLAALRRHVSVSNSEK